MKLIVKFIIIISFVLGFMTAAHWDTGREYYLEYTPLTQKAVKTQTESVKESLKEHVQKMVEEKKQ